VFVEQRSVEARGLRPGKPMMGTMKMTTTGGIAETMAGSPSSDVWSKTCVALKRELGEATFGSWLGQAALRERGDEVCLVAATPVAMPGAASANSGRRTIPWAVGST
jgi:hypothetical protein